MRVGITSNYTTVFVHLPEIVLILHREITHWLLLEVKGLRKGEKFSVVTYTHRVTLKYSNELENEI